MQEEQIFNLYAFYILVSMNTIVKSNSYIVESWKSTINTEYKHINTIIKYSKECINYNTVNLTVNGIDIIGLLNLYIIHFKNQKLISNCILIGDEKIIKYFKILMENKRRDINIIKLLY